MNCTPLVTIACPCRLDWTLWSGTRLSSGENLFIRSERVPVPACRDMVGRRALNVKPLLDQIGKSVAEGQRANNHIAHRLNTPLTRLQAGHTDLPVASLVPNAVELYAVKAEETDVTPAFRADVDLPMEAIAVAAIVPLRGIVADFEDATPGCISVANLPVRFTDWRLDAASSKACPGFPPGRPHLRAGRP